MIYVNNWQSLRKKSTSLLLCIALSFQFVGTSFVSAASSILGTTGDFPSAINIDTAGNIYTANYGSNNVTKITPAGVSTILGTTGTGPLGITVDTAGNIYTANLDSNNVTKITPAGVSTILGTTGTNPWGITVDTAGNIYTTNSSSNNVTKITPAGVSTILGTTGTLPYDITIDSAGNIYTANFGSNNVTKITPAGVSTILGTTGTSPVGITVDTAGNIYTANYGSNNVTKITPAGVSTILGTTGTSPVGITVDTAGNIYTANLDSNNVTKITPAGVSTILGTTGTNPWGITVDTAGNIYTANASSNNVTKIENPAPTDITLSGTTVADGAIAPIIVGTLSTTDPDVGDTHTYFLNRCTIPGTDDASFSLSGNVLSLATTPDYATQSSYNICIRTVDAGGLTYDKNFVINVVDTTPPAIPTCTASPSTTSGATTVTCTGTESGATLTIPGLSCSPTPADATGTVLCTGTILTSNPTLTIADPSGNTATGTVTVTLDTTPPAIPTCTASPSTTSGATTVTCTGTESGATLTIPGLTCSPTPANTTGTVSCTGSILTSNPTLTIADPSGNTATGTVTVTLDTTPPTVPTCTASPSTTSGATTVTCTGTESGATLTIPGLTCSPTPADATGAVSCAGTILTSNPTLTLVDPSGNTATGTVTVTLDITAPAIPILLTPGSGSTLTDNTPTFSGTGEVGATIILTISGQTLTGTVNASGSWTITPATLLIDGAYTVVVTQKDPAGNTSSTASLPFTVDTTSPVVTLSGSSTITLPFGTTYTELGASWTDNIDGSGTILTATSGSVNPNIAGTYTLTYRYIDRGGNTATVTRTVTISAQQSSGGGGGGGGGGTYIPPVTSHTGTTVTPPVYSTGIDTSKISYVLLPTQSHASYLEQNTSNQNVYTIENRITDYICPKIVQVYGEDQLLAKDLGSSVFTDDMKSVIMYRGLEKDEQMNGQTFEEYKKFGIAINDESFEPTRNVTRAEYVKMLVRALSCRYQKEGTNTPFSDVPETMWYAEYINFATNHGWINGYEDGTFRPDAPITRAEAAKILANAIQLQVNTKNNKSTFSDVSSQSVFSPYIETLRSHKVINGRTPTSYAPDAYIPRTEASRLIYRTFLGGNN